MDLGEKEAQRFRIISSITRLYSDYQSVALTLNFNTAPNVD